MPRKRRPVASSFPLEVGVAPYVVRVVERADKAGMVYLQWWKPSRNNHGWLSLKFRCAGRTPEEIAALVITAQAKAQQKYEELSGQRAPERAATKRVITLTDAWALLTDPAQGKYPQDSRYRRQLAEALTLAAATEMDRTGKVTLKASEAKLMTGEAAVFCSERGVSRMYSLSRV